jgi:hypothetical protein
MEDIFFIYKSTFATDGYVEIIGNYLGYNVAKIQKAYIDNRIYISHLKPLIIREDLALAWKFADCYDPKLTVKKKTNVLTQLENCLTECQLEEVDNKTKTKYKLSEKDIALGIEFHKLILYKIIEDRFSEKYLQLCIYGSDLEKASWAAQQYEVQLPNDFEKPVLQALANNKGISLEEMICKVKQKIADHNYRISILLTEEQKLKSEVKACKTIADCHRLRHLKFGVSMSIQQMQDEKIEMSPATLKITF